MKMRIRSVITLVLVVVAIGSACHSVQESYEFAKGAIPHMGWYLEQARTYAEMAQTGNQDARGMVVWAWQYFNTVEEGLNERAFAWDRKDDVGWGADWIDTVPLDELYSALDKAESALSQPDATDFEKLREALFQLGKLDDAQDEADAQSA